MDTSPPPSTHTNRTARRRVGALAAGGVLAVGTLGVAGAALAAGRDGTTAGTPAAYTPTDGGYAAPPAGWYRDRRSTQGSATTEATDTTDASDAQSSGLVEISTTTAAGDAAGTGMLLTSDGLVLTNHHVVEGATRIRVTVVSTGRTYTADYVGSDATADVAVLELEGASGLPTVDLDTGGVSTGATVTSVGDAGGDGGALTAAAGTVAALDQDITVQDDGGGSSRLTGLIEVDADLVPGDSGGALLDADGEVVGMNVAASSGSAQVTGYVIPIRTVLAVADAIEAGQASSTVAIGYDGYLGVGLSTQTDTPVVGTVEEGSAAADAGIVAGDTITAVSGTAVANADALSTAIRAHDPGDRVTVAWTTADGARRSATVTLGRAPIA